MNPRTWRLWAHECESGKDGTGAFRHIGKRRYVELHLMNYPIVEVNITEDKNGNYWGWLSKGENEPKMIWPSKAQFEVCFIYGPEMEVEHGKGEILRLRVEKLTDKT